MYPFTLKAKGIALLTAMLFSFVSLAQVRDTLNEVHVKGHRRQLTTDDKFNRFAPGEKLAVVDSITLQQYRFQSVANLLAQQVPVFVKSYGFNTLATLSFRGASAAQSQVYWNGVPLQNAALGITDVSLLRTSSFSRVNIAYGGSAALLGSGNVGGALMLENEQPFFNIKASSHTAVSGVAGSFGQYEAGAQCRVSTAKWYAAANIDLQMAKNNFTYEENGILSTTTNSNVQGHTLQLVTAYKANDKNVLSLTGWVQDYTREIPKATFETASLKLQTDGAIRVLANWDRNTQRSHLYAKLAYLRDDLRYTDSAALISSQNRTQQLYEEVGLRRTAGSQQFMIFLPVQYAWMHRPLLNDVVDQQRISVAGAYALSLFDERLHAALDARAMLVDNDLVPFGGLSASYRLLPWFSIRGNVQRSYRAPTLNELYYVPGGNDKLKPEQGWSRDVGYSLKTAADRSLVFYHDLSYFNRCMDDWIIWFGGSIWTPHNIATVHSRGVETENKLEYNIGDWRLHLGLNTAFVLATTEESYLPGDGSIGKQIPYTPRYNGQLNAGFIYKSFYFNYNHTYTGYRFITVDESSWLVPYNTGNLQASYTTRIKKSSSIVLSAQCNNIWSRQYMVVNGRPMPGINWLAGVTWHIYK